MLNDNKISEIKIIIDGLLKDIESLSEAEMVSHLKWEEILMSASLISHKLNTLRIEQERSNMKRYLLTEDANNQFDANDNEFKRLTHTITQLKKEMSEMRLNISKSILPEEMNRPHFEEDSPHFEQEPMYLKTEPEQIEGESEQSIINIQANNNLEEIVNEKNEVDSDQVDLDFLLDKRSLMDISVPYSSEPEWMKDMPGLPVEDLRMAVTLNDKLFFIRELFNEDEDQYRLSMEKLNDFSSFSEALDYTRDAFQEWDERSDAAYRFYMILRRRYNG